MPLYRQIERGFHHLKKSQHKTSLAENIKITEKQIEVHLPTKHVRVIAFLFLSWALFQYERGKPFKGKL